MADAAAKSCLLDGGRLRFLTCLLTAKAFAVLVCEGATLELVIPKEVDAKTGRKMAGDAAGL